MRKPFQEWSNEAQESKRLSNLALSIFKRAVNNSKLTPQAVMAYFNVRQTGFSPRTIPCSPTPSITLPDTLY